MGARVVLQCLRRLRRRGGAGRGIVETAVCMGTPYSADPAVWHEAAQVKPSADTELKAREGHARHAKLMLAMGNGGRRNSSKHSVHPPSFRPIRPER
mmetsp:Transcript_29469/g.77513  ORF Transcript_29469/g.77513 Transcript_29469/m.77513 type:complete len:97 (-) Transcript_29469:374-664(-)